MKKKIVRRCDGFFRKMDRLGLALAYKDVRLKTCYSDILPEDADLHTWFSRNVSLNMPLVSAAMDTVTEDAMAIAMAEMGGLGIIHKNLSPESQAKAVDRVKHKLNAFITDPIFVNENQTVQQVLDFVERKKYNFHSFLVKNNSGIIVGLVTSRDFKFCIDKSRKIADIMTKNIIDAPVNTGVKRAYRIMMQKHITILPVFTRKRELKGIYTLSDVERIVSGLSPDYNLAKDGTLKVGAAVGPISKDAEQRMELLAKAKVDVVVIDTAHGDTKGVIAMVKYCKRHYSNIDVVAGNVAEPEGARDLARAGADGVKVGIGPGSICTTRLVAGVGCPQVSAVYDCANVLRGSGVPVNGDGGVEHSGDLSVGLGAGADSIMIGRLFAGTTESPGELIVLPDGRRIAIYRGMGSLSALRESAASRERYGQTDVPVDKLVPQGVETEIEYQGPVYKIVYQLVGGLRAGMGFCGAGTIPELQKKADFRRITNAGWEESRPHGLGKIKDAPNYHQ